MVTIMVTKTPWTILIRQHVAYPQWRDGTQDQVKITSSHYGYKKTMHTNSSDYRFLGDKVHLVKCRLSKYGGKENTWQYLALFIVLLMNILEDCV